MIINYINTLVLAVSQKGREEAGREVMLAEVEG